MPRSCHAEACTGPTETLCPHSSYWSPQKRFPLLAPLRHSLRVPFSKVAIPQVFLRPVSGIWHSVARRPRDAVVSRGAGSQLRVPIVNRGGAGGSTGAGQHPQLVLSPQPASAALGCRFQHCPQSWRLLLVLAEPKARHTLPGTAQTGPLSLSRESWGPGPSSLVGGHWPGSRARIECRPDGWMVQERIRCQQSGSPGSPPSWAAGASACPRELEPQT